MSGVRDTWVVFRHATRAALRQKAGLFFGMLQPALFLALFGPLFATIGTWEVLVPGLIVQLALLSAGLAGFGVVFDARFGVLDRVRVTPVARTALLLGRALSASVTLLAQTVLLIAMGYGFGLRAPLAGVLLALPLVALLGVGLAALSHAVALTMNPDAFAPVMTTAVVPLTLLSGALLPMSMAPGWLDALSRLTPFRYAVEAVRELFAGHYTGPAVTVGVAVTAVFCAVCTAAGVRVFSRAGS